MDTYDLSAYNTHLLLDLRPGYSSTFNQEQLAVLGRAHAASGNIYNALQYMGDKRSLIENAIGGNGNDKLIGNSADNVLAGRQGSDSLCGNTGSDTLGGGSGDDRLSGGVGNDTIYGKLGDDAIRGGGGDDHLFGGKGADVFEFASNSGADMIYGFHSGIDVIALDGLGNRNANQIFNGAVQDGDNVVIKLDDESTITLVSFDLHHLSVADFEIH